MKKLKQRVMAFAAAAALVSTSALSGIISRAADASAYMVMNLYGDTANDGYSAKELSEATLLVGDNNPLKADDGSAATTIKNAENTYFLGIASQFATFIEGNMTVTDADEEGRAAVGGNLNFTGGWNYQVGSGDYASSTPLMETDVYSGITNFAHAIVGGTYTNINIISNSTTDRENDYYKRLVVGDETNFNNSTHYSNLNGLASGYAYTASCKHDDYISSSGSHYVNEKAQFYAADLIDFDELFTMLEERSITVSKISGTGTME